MKIFYGQNKIDGSYGFFTDRHNTPECKNPIPKDAVEVTAAEHAALLNGQASGKQEIVPNKNGRPVLVDRPK